MKKQLIWLALLAAIIWLGIGCTAHAGSGLQKCTIQPLQTPGSRPPGAPQPACGLELTCTDKPVLLGYHQGVCFRASCPGIWGVIHTRIDQASFRRRFFSCRQYAFRGYWQLKDQGLIEAGAAPIRELFLVLPGDLIELRLTDPDCCAKVEIRNLGYIKTGCVRELQEWLAYYSYLERAGFGGESLGAGGSRLPSCHTGSSRLDQARWPSIARVLSLGRTIGLPLPSY